MDKHVVKAFAYFMAANFQAVLMIGMAYELLNYLEASYRDSFPWSYIVWPSCVFLVGQIYYLMIRYVLKLDAESRKK